MPMMIVCPDCSRRAPVPETSGRFRCGGCNAVLDLSLYVSNGECEAYEQYARDRRARIFNPPPPHVKRPAIVFVEAAQKGSIPSPGLTPDQDSQRP